MIKNYKKLAVFMAIMILTLSIASTGFAANELKNLKAYYRNIKIFKNGIQAQMSFEPFIVDDVTYVPLRAISELLDKEVTWNGLNYSIAINDKPGQNLNDMYAQIMSQQQTIAQLEAKIKNLEAQKGGNTSSITTIAQMEKHLNKEYGTYSKIDFDIDLKESKNKIEVGIYVDLDDYETKWTNLSSSSVKKYLQDIVDDIRDAFSTKTISGFVEDSSYDEELLRFTVSSKGVVSTSKSSSGNNGDVEDVEYDLDKTYSGKNGIKSVELTESKSKLKLVLYVDKTAWNKLSDSKWEDILENMYDDIRDYLDGTINGEIVDNSTGKTLYEFDYSSKGVVTID